MATCREVFGIEDFIMMLVTVLKVDRLKHHKGLDAELKR